MSADLYDIIGVARTATQRAIELAYRRRSKDCHPDAGGDPAAWEVLRQAYDVLRDPARRRVYDETGEARPSAADNAHAYALTYLSAILDETVANLTKQHFEVTAVDLVAAMRATLQQKLVALDQKERAVEAAVALYERIADRFKTKREGQANMLAGLVRAKIAAARAQLGAYAREREAANRALDLLNDYSFATSLIGTYMVMVTW